MDNVFDIATARKAPEPPHVRQLRDTILTARYIHSSDPTTVRVVEGLARALYYAVAEAYELHPPLWEQATDAERGTYAMAAHDALLTLKPETCLYCNRVRVYGDDRAPYCSSECAAIATREGA